MKQKKGSISSPLSPAKREAFIVTRILPYIIFLAATAGLTSCNPKTESNQAGEDDIGGVVTGTNGPEAGVWVIAETHDLPTRFAKIVVTDDKGQYLIPDLPSANYSVWVRGYGLVDSPKKESKPGSTLNLEAVVAPDPHAAAEYYPAGYWFSLLHVPGKDKFPEPGLKEMALLPAF